MKKLVSRGGKAGTLYAAECLREFRIFKGQNALGSQEHIPKELRTSLDGRYYDKLD